MLPGPTGAAGTVQRLNVFASTRRQAVCPNCKDRGTVVYDNHSGDQLCSECGQVLEARMMSEEQEWRTFSSSDGGTGTDRNRVGGPHDVWLDDSVQGTSIMGGDRRFNRLAQTHEVATGASSGDRQLMTAFKNLRLVTDHFGLKENVVERCKEMVKDLQTAGNLRSRTGTTYTLAIVYLACREENLSFSLKELVSFDQTITEKDLGKTVNKVKKSLPARNATPTTYASAELVPRHGRILQLAEPVLATAECIARKTEQMVTATSVPKKPQFVSAASILFAVQLHNISAVSSADIAQAAKSGHADMMAIYKAMLPLIRSLVPPRFVPMNVGGYTALRQG